MYIIDAQQFETQEVQSEGVENVKIQWLIDESCGAPNFAMRRFIVGPHGHTPRHAHDWEHEVYVVRGHGILVTEDGETQIGPDQAVFVPGGETHQFISSEDEVLEMLCLVPNGPATEH